MRIEILLTIAGLLAPVALGALALVIEMRIQIAILKEKANYQAGQIRRLLGVPSDSDE